MYISCFIGIVKLNVARIIDLLRCNYGEAKENGIPGGEMVLSRTEGIVISITGLVDEKPSAASLYAISISSMLKSK